MENKDFLESLHKIESIDVVENVVDSLLLGSTSLIPNLGSLNPEMTVYYYDVLKVAEDARIKSTNGVQAIMVGVEELYLENRMILSSSKEERMIENFKNFAKGPAKIDAEAIKKETKAIIVWKKTAGICLENKGELKVSKDLNNWVSENMVKTSTASKLRFEIKEKSQKENKGIWSKEFIAKVLEKEYKAPMKDLAKLQVPG